MHRQFIVMTLAHISLLACNREKTVDFPDGLAPLDAENRATPPKGTSADPYPEEISIITGSEDEYEWGHGFAYVHAPIDKVWEAIQDPDVDVDRARVDSWTTEWDVDPDYEVSYRISNVAEDLITVEWDVDWRHGLVDGSAATPEVVGARFLKSDGSSLIETLEGSVTLYWVEDDTTTLEIMQHLSATATEADAIQAYFEDFFIDVVAFVNDEPLPDIPSER